MPSRMARTGTGTRGEMPEVRAGHLDIPVHRSRFIPGLEAVFRRIGWDA
jgi:hypothetical protein